MDKHELLKSVKRLVVKVGTSTITSPDLGLNLSRIDVLCEEISLLKNVGLEIILVSSGAIVAGMGRLSLKSRPKDMPTLQAAAAVGQCILMHTYEERFRRRRQAVAQMLLTQDDLNDRKRYTNINNALQSLLSHGVIPIINENDTVAVDEIKVGDNDTLAALATNLSESDLLLILSDTDGFYTADPKRFPNAELIPAVFNITPELKRAAGKQSGLSGTGGMSTKLRAAEIVTGSGEMMVLANGSEPNVIGRILSGEDLGTIFLPTGSKMPSRKRWIAYTLPTKGSLQLDSGAKGALINDGKSLLASGIMRVVGDFEFGDPVSLVDGNGREFARGLINYRSEEVRRVCGRKTNEIESILGYCYYDEIIHRNNLVLLSKGDNSGA